MQAARLLHQVSATSAYHTLQEEFYLEQSIDKAIAIDEWAGETVTTSMVDDVFYILRLCGHRALDTGNLPCVCAVLGQLNTLLSQNYRTALEGQWKVGTGEPALCVHRAGAPNHVSVLSMWYDFGGKWKVCVEAQELCVSCIKVSMQPASARASKALQQHRTGHTAVQASYLVNPPPHDAPGLAGSQHASLSRPCPEKHTARQNDVWAKPLHACCVPCNCRGQHLPPGGTREAATSGTALQWPRCFACQGPEI